MTAELFSIPVGDAYLVYAPIRQAAFLANAAVVNLLADLQQGSPDLSVPGANEWLELLRQLEIVDGGEETKPVTTFRGDPKPTTVTLFLTTACNLRCTYCYASAGDTPTRVMTLEVAQRGIDFVLANAIELGKCEIEIAYHGGGEPSVNWKTLTESWEYAYRKAAEAGIQVRAAMASNGVMADDKIDWIIKHLDGVSLSFDGLPEVHDTHRLTVLGQGSSSAVMHTISRFDAAGFPYGLRLTVTREHLDKIEASVRFICENYRPQRIQVEPAYALGRWRDAPSAETAEFINGFRAASAVASAYGHNLEFSGARVGTLANHFCGVTQDSFCLTADGSVSGCYEVFLEQNNWSDYFMYGRYNVEKSTYDFNLPILNNLRKQTVEKHEFCQGCFAKWTCGGDCHHKALDINGPGEFAGTDRCHIIRELTLDQILQKVADSGGLFWHQAPPELVIAQ
ncbi:MAG: radical SAM protein [Planctomycetaceae bacterium]|nr:radical SAM protein [Planctomycetaceae bacterium]